MCVCVVCVGEVRRGRELGKLKGENVLGPEYFITGKCQDEGEMGSPVCVCIVAYVCWCQGSLQILQQSENV